MREVAGAPSLSTSFSDTIVLPESTALRRALARPWLSLPVPLGIGTGWGWHRVGRGAWSPRPNLPFPNCGCPLGMGSASPWPCRAPRRGETPALWCCLGEAVQFGVNPSR